jgi:lipoprotein-anchoring transpeptidase ErfK/SrfK
MEEIKQYIKKEVAMKTTVITVLVLIIFRALSFAQEVPLYSSEEIPLDSYTIKEGDDIWELFGDDWRIISRINRMSVGAFNPGVTIKIPRDMKEARRHTPFPLRVSKKGKLIYISTINQALALYEKGKLVEWMPISSGAPGNETPKGKFRVSEKVIHYYSKTYPKPRGGAAMPFALRFSHPYSGYFIHGGALSGRPTSKGCVRLLLDDAAMLYQWSEVGTMIVVQ